MVHAFTGCDNTSFFAGQRMKTAWKTWDNFPDVTSAFMKLTSTPSALSNESLAIIERFVILMYDRISRFNKVSVDMTFFMIFVTHEIFLVFAFVIPLLSGQRCLEFLLTKKGRWLEDFYPPTTLLNGMWRAPTTIAEPVLPDPTDWGWIFDREGKMKPQRTTLPAAAVSCKELVCCGCKNNCGKRYKCVKADLPCTPLCMCDGQCIRD